MIISDNIRILDNGVIEIDIPDSLIKDAEEYTDANRVENNSSIFKGADNRFVNLIGYIAEHCFHYVFPEANKQSTLDYDFIWKNQKIDVKAKLCNSVPQSNFIVSVLAYTINQQKNDYYVFVRVKADKSKCWILGLISKVDYKTKSTFKKEGSVCEATGYVYRKDSYDLEIKDLYKMKKMIVI